MTKDTPNDSQSRPDVAGILASMNWDDRLAAARERRAKVLAEKSARRGETEKTVRRVPVDASMANIPDPTSQPPELINEDEVDLGALEGVDLSQLTAEPKPVPPVAPQVDATGTSQNTLVMPPPPAFPKPGNRATPVSAPAKVQGRGTMPAARVAAYALFGVCFGLGLGFGLGATVPWISQLLTPQPIIASTPPEAQIEVQRLPETSAFVETAVFAGDALEPPAVVSTPAAAFAPQPDMAPIVTTASAAAFINPRSGISDEGPVSVAALETPLALSLPGASGGVDPVVSLATPANPALVASSFVAPLTAPGVAPPTFVGPAEINSVPPTGQSQPVTDLLELTFAFASAPPQAARAVALPRATPRELGFAPPEAGSRIRAPALTSEVSVASPPPAQDFSQGSIMTASLTAPSLPPVRVLTPAPAPNAGLAWLPSEVVLAPPEYANPYSNLRILVRAPAGLPDNTVESLQEKLTTSGAAISDLKRVTFNVSQSHARFFSPENKEAAQRIAAAIGGQARDFTSFSPAPPQGTIEIYLAGRSNVRSTRTSRATTRRQTEAEILRNRVIRRLRLGEILQ